MGKAFQSLGNLLIHQATYSWAGVIVVGLGLYYASGQLRLSTSAQYGNTIYNTEKDFKKLLDRTQEADFVKCYDSKVSQETEALPAICPSIQARQTFFDLLSFLELLFNLQNLSAIDERYVKFKMMHSCSYLKTPRGKSTFTDFEKQNLFASPFIEFLHMTCRLEK